MKLTIYIFFSIVTYSQVFFSANQSGLAESNLQIYENPLDKLNNPAASFTSEKLDFAASYTPQIYGIQDISSFSFGLNKLFSKNIESGLLLNRFGNNIYSELNIGICFSLRYSKYSIGIVLLNEFTRIKNYDNSSNIKLIAGSRIKLTENLFAGLIINNLNSSNFDSSILIKSGICYVINKSSFIFTAVEKETNFKPDLLLGLKHNLLKSVSFCIGHSTLKNKLCCGFNLKIDFLSINYAAEFHRYLGSTHSFGISFNEDIF